ncbi:uncharacterized protein LOC134244986 [Saccostrea cucullata]|uniref:uncharacterized protein LOC134244986 n=1 Tax=Saccostrea cuccullata TaxID=36930 RepID=UPI002ED1AD99
MKNLLKLSGISVLVFFSYIHCTYTDAQEISGNCSEGSQTLNCCYNFYLIEEQCKPCNDGYFGDNCSVKCKYPEYGKSCGQRCTCPSEQCNHVYGCQARDITTPGFNKITTSQQITSTSQQITSTFINSNEETSETHMVQADTGHETTIKSEMDRQLSTQTVRISENDVKNNNSVIIIIGTIIASFLAILTVVQIYGKCKPKEKKRISTNQNDPETYEEIEDAAILLSIRSNRYQDSRMQQTKYDELKETTKNEYLFIKCETQDLTNEEKHDEHISDTANISSVSQDQLSKLSKDSDSPERDKESYLEPVVNPTPHHYTDVLENPYLDVIHNKADVDNSPSQDNVLSLQYDDVLPNRTEKSVKYDKSKMVEDNISAENYLDVINMV